MWVIYFDPIDYPGQYVARRHDVTPGRVIPGVRCRVTNNLASARAIPESLGMVNIGRQPGDEPQIVEVWV